MKILDILAGLKCVQKTHLRPIQVVHCQNGASLVLVANEGESFTFTRL